MPDAGKRTMNYAGNSQIYRNAGKDNGHYYNGLDRVWGLGQFPKLGSHFGTPEHSLSAVI